MSYNLSRIALYLSGKLPPHTNAEHNRMHLFKVVRGIIGEEEANDFLKVIDTDRYYSMLLSEVERINPEELLQLFETLEIPNDARGPVNQNSSDTKGKISKRPVILFTEGKTDALILQNAWKKLYKMDCPYKIKACGAIEGNSGSDVLKHQLQHFHGMIESEIVIGIFDNDIAGNTSFKGLSNTLFEEWNLGSDLRKSSVESIYALLLPVPEFRSCYVDWSSAQRYLAIEHYFEDEILTKKHNNMKGNNIANGSCFEITGNKNNFSRESINLDASAFSHFEILFERLKEIINAEINLSS